MSKEQILKLSRRDFLKISSTAGTGLLVSIYLSSCQNETDLPAGDSDSLPDNAEENQSIEDGGDLLESQSAPGPFSEIQPNVFIKIDTTGLVTITAPKPDLGQGVRTALPMIIAEELEINWSSVQIIQAPADLEYSDQNVGGSNSVSGMFSALRRAGTAVRELLIATAADIWDVDSSVCFARNGVVYHEPGDEALPYGDLVTKIEEINPSWGNLKDSREFQLIGKSLEKKDTPNMVDGSAIFGSDISVPEMYYAVIARPPQLVNEIVAYDDAPALAVPGVRQVVPVDSGIAIVAENTWQAIKGREALEIVWEEVPSKSFSTSSEELSAEVEENSFRASYLLPHFAHVPMEPMTCMADVQEDVSTIWAPTQHPMDAKNLAQFTLRGTTSEENIEVKIPLIGGGFGRRIQVDYVPEAVQLSHLLKSPVKVFWSREEDISHDFFHQGSKITVEAPLDSPRSPRLSSSQLDSPARTGAWRAVQNNNEAFARESFLDEYAEILNLDPVELRRQLYSNDLLIAVMEKVVSESGWGEALPDGHVHGLSCFSTWGVTHVAEVAEVSIETNGIRVHKVVCAVDCGIVVNPNIVKEQIEGGIVFALSAALGNEITFKDGIVEQSNFHDFPILRIDQMPEVEVHIIESERFPQGVGEMAGPPLYAAVANALYALTGKRFRKLPFRL